MSAEAIGIDVGGTKTAALRVSEAGEVLARSEHRTPAEDQDATLAAIERAVGEVRTGNEAAIGIGAAGLVEMTQGVLLSSPNLAWRHVPLRERLAGRFDLPVTVDNDATAAAYAESRLGASRGRRDSLLVAVGTGIGGGIVAGGRLLRGAHGLAGEIGHIIVDPTGPICGCGNRGCWEQVASGLAIARAGREAVIDHPTSMIARLTQGDASRTTGELVAQAAQEGDEVARRIFAGVGRRLGEGVAGLVNVLDPEIVVVGGGPAEAGELLLGPLREAFHEAVEGDDVRPEVPIVAAALGNDAGAIGAALLALEEVKG